MNVISIAHRLFHFLWTTTMAFLGWTFGVLYEFASWLVHRGMRTGKGLFTLKRNLKCSRGHEMPADGHFECGCGARFSGWAWGQCPNCYAVAGYYPCAVCGTAIRNPHLH